MEGRRRITLYDRMTATTTTSLADFLADHQRTNASAELSRNRTLIDILREEAPHNKTATDRKSWKAFNFIDKLRLKRALTSAESNENGNTNNNDSNRNSYPDPDELTQHGMTRQRQNDVVAAAVEPETVAVGGPVGVSLMDLLEETDMEAGLQVSSYGMSNADYEDANENWDGGIEEGAGAVGHNCCVCMVRHKGAAFIPCGHTFCRTCSREVWVNRGNCPLCNNFILEILDIF